jgi:hypothetical protein
VTRSPLKLLGLGPARSIIVGGPRTCIISVPTTLSNYAGGTRKCHDHRSDDTDLDHGSGEFWSTRKENRRLDGQHDGCGR